VPAARVQDGKIVLNVSPGAVRHFELNAQLVSFSARFGGNPFSVECPLPAVRAIYARENGQGVAFPESEDSTGPAPEPSPPAPSARKGPVLKRIK
jgi:stringent starvation protein B